MATIILAVVTIVCLIISFAKSRVRTKSSLKTAVKTGKGMVPEVGGILLIISVLLAVINKDLIAATLGNENALISTGIGALLGSITIIPGVMAFPLSKELLAAGASSIALAAFITTLTMVGLATSPIEKKFFGLRFTVIRNALSFVFAIIIALAMGLFI
ncbi:MAG TPA: hypothetical protein VFC68_04250 [Treponemataceae bacterium]|nr:hypothetical protein [Treponemataceae bacterium]